MRHIIMNKITKKLILLAVFSCAGIYLLDQSVKPVELVAAHDGDVVLVKNFSRIKPCQITWWENSKQRIKEKYNIPDKTIDGDYRVYIQNFGEGYRVDSNTDQNSDLLCFDDMTSTARCIKKDPLLTVGYSKKTGTFYW